MTWAWAHPKPTLPVLAARERVHDNRTTTVQFINGSACCSVLHRVGRMCRHNIYIYIYRYTYIYITRIATHHTTYARQCNAHLKWPRTAYYKTRDAVAVVALFWCSCSQEVNIINVTDGNNAIWKLCIYFSILVWDRNGARGCTHRHTHITHTDQAMYTAIV